MSTAALSQADDKKPHRSYRGLGWRFREAPGSARRGAWTLDEVLRQRGIDDEARPGFLRHTLQGMPNPLSFIDMGKAVDRVADLLAKRGRIALFGDYDVDGATSSAIVQRYVRMACPDAPEPLIYIPDRMKEGYGPNAPALLKLKNEGIDLVLCLDSGTTAHAPLAAAADAGLDIVVVDHHVAEHALPPATAIVNPNRPDQPREAGDHGYMCTAGIAWLFCVALDKALGDAGVFANRDRPRLSSLLDLVALGTVADVVPLIGFNRPLVALGLQVMERRQNAGIAALLRYVEESEIKAWHLGFVLGPRVNASGRIDDCGLGSRLLTTDDPAEAKAIAESLDRINEERRRLCDETLDEAVQAIEAGGTAGEPNGDEVWAHAGDAFLVVGKPSWHPGIVGVVASRLKERYDRPALVLGASDGAATSWKGSARSVTGFDLGRAVIAARQQGILSHGGGHPMAAGLSIASNRLPELSRYLEDAAAPVFEHGDARSYSIDLAVSPGEIDVADLEDMKVLEPFGQGNPEPRVALTNVTVSAVKVLKDRHIRLDLVSGDGRRSRTKAMAFGAVGTPLGDALLAAEGGRLDVAGKLRVNEWNGYVNVEMLLEDARESSPSFEIGSQPGRSAPGEAKSYAKHEPSEP